VRSKNKTILVAGGTSGIGAAAAVRFAAEGARVFLTGRRAETGDKIVAKIKCEGSAATFIRADIKTVAIVRRW